MKPAKVFLADDHLILFLIGKALLLVRINKGLADISNGTPDLLIAKNLAKGLHRVELVLLHCSNFPLLY